jgi:hypothetical protein
MVTPLGDDREPDDLDRLIKEITVDSHGDDEQLEAFRQAFEDAASFPCDGFVIGEPVSILEIGYAGNVRRGLTATCRREDGSVHVVSVLDVAFPRQWNGTRSLAAYRTWQGMPPFPADVSPPPRRTRQHKVTEADLDMAGTVELVVLSLKGNAVRCRLLGTERVITLRADRPWDVVPAEIAVVKPKKQWRYAGHPYLSGRIDSVRLDVAALGLVPLRLVDEGTWTPGEHYWGEDGEPLEEWTKPIIARGPRQMFEMEQVLPGWDPADSDEDPIGESNDLKDAGDFEAATRKLMDLCQVDLRCLDAHAHLGNLAFDYRPEFAIRHYEAGLRIGELSLGASFDGLLPWGLIDNRPFLRCMHGYGLCAWRLGQFDEAGRIFDRMLWLNPADNQGVRFLVEEVRTRTAWVDRPEWT